MLKSHLVDSHQPDNFRCVEGLSVDRTAGLFDFVGLEITGEVHGEDPGLLEEASRTSSARVNPRVNFGWSSITCVFAGKGSFSHLYLPPSIGSCLLKSKSHRSRSLVCMSVIICFRSAFKLSWSGSPNKHFFSGTDGLISILLRLNLQLIPEGGISSIFRCKLARAQKLGCAC